jgi:hypothetical protein
MDKMKTMKTLDYIPFNIWDDYEDVDVDVINGGDTHGYIEEFDVLTEEQKGEICTNVFNFMKTLDLFGVRTHDSCGEIGFENLSHKRRERLIEELNSANLKYKEIPMKFYSES